MSRVLACLFTVALLTGAATAADCVKLTPYEARLGVKAHSGVLVLDVASDSIADRAGLQAGDLIVRVNNRTMRDAGQYQMYLGQLREQALWNVADAEVVRDGQLRHVMLRLANPEERFGFASGLAFLVESVRPGAPAAAIQPGEFLLELAGHRLSELKGPVEVDALLAAEKVQVRLGRITSTRGGEVTWTTRTIEVGLTGQGPLDGPSAPPGVTHEPGLKKR